MGMGHLGPHGGKWWTREGTWMMGKGWDAHNNCKGNGRMVDALAIMIGIGRRRGEWQAGEATGSSEQ